MSEISAQGVKDLRDKTGAGMMECKAALQEAKGDAKRAEELLKQKGLTRAEKFSQRQTKAGRIGAYIQPDGRFGAMVEISCETDFAANTEDFKGLVRDLCMHVIGMAPEAVDRTGLSAALIEEEKKKYIEDTKGKPPEIAEKIVEGKLTKNLYAKKCLLDQPFVNEEKFKGSVGELLKSRISKVGENMTIRRFARFELGA